MGTSFHPTAISSPPADTMDAPTCLDRQAEFAAAASASYIADSALVGVWMAVSNTISTNRRRLVCISSLRRSLHTKKSEWTKSFRVAWPKVASSPWSRVMTLARSADGKPRSDKRVSRSPSGANTPITHNVSR